MFSLRLLFIKQQSLASITSSIKILVFLLCLSVLICSLNDDGLLEYHLLQNKHFSSKVFTPKQGLESIVFEVIQNGCKLFSQPMCQFCLEVAVGRCHQSRRANLSLTIPLVILNFPCPNMMHICPTGHPIYNRGFGDGPASTVGFS